jgi:hypothetical protein
MALQGKHFYIKVARNLYSDIQFSDLECSPFFPNKGEVQGVI